MPAEVVLKDCWDVAVSRCGPCVRAGMVCEIWLGSTKRTAVHAEACVVKNGQKIWLKNVGKHGILIDPGYRPRGFHPIMKFSYQHFVDTMYQE